MPSPRVLLLSLLALFAVPQPADARPREHDQAWQKARRGTIMPLPEIEGRVVPRMRGSTYLGPEFDSGTVVYRLKFIRAGKIIFVDVDARTGRVLGIAE